MLGLSFFQNFITDWIATCFKVNETISIFILSWQYGQFKAKVTVIMPASLLDCVEKQELTSNKG